MELGLSSFLSAGTNDPVDFLGLEPLVQLQNDGLSLEPGQVIAVYPPFCTEEAKEGVSLSPVSIKEALTFLSDFSKKISSAESGGKIRIQATE